MDKVAILIPCYNEEKTIEKVVKDFKKEVPEAKIYVYDDKLLITLWYSDDKHEVPFCDISTTMTEFECSASPPGEIRTRETL